MLLMKIGRMYLSSKTLVLCVSAKHLKLNQRIFLFKMQLIFYVIKKKYLYVYLAQMHTSVHREACCEPLVRLDLVLKNLWNSQVKFLRHFPLVKNSSRIQKLHILLIPYSQTCTNGQMFTTPINMESKPGEGRMKTFNISIEQEGYYIWNLTPKMGQMGNQPIGIMLLPLPPPLLQVLENQTCQNPVKFFCLLINHYNVSPYLHINIHKSVRIWWQRYVIGKLEEVARQE